MKHRYTISILTILIVALATILFVSAAQAEGDTPDEINISYVKSPFNLPIMVMRNRGLLEKEFADDGIEIAWHEITSGARQAEALAAGSLDIASVINSTSVVLANAAGNELLIPAAFSRPEQTFGIVSMESGPASVEELVGKRVAGPKGTVLHQILVAALENAGMSVSDVEFFSMGLPDARTALLSGEIDAALLAASLIIRTTEAGGRVIATAEGNAIPKLVVGVRPAFYAQHGDLVRRYVEVQNDAMRYIDENLEEALAIGVEEHGISIEDARTLYQWADFTMTLQETDVDSIRDDVAFLLDQGLIDESVDPDSFVLPEAVE